MADSPEIQGWARSRSWLESLTPPPPSTPDSSSQTSNPSPEIDAPVLPQPTAEFSRDTLRSRVEDLEQFYPTFPTSSDGNNYEATDLEQFYPTSPASSDGNYYEATDINEAPTSAQPLEGATSRLPTQLAPPSSSPDELHPPRFFWRDPPNLFYLNCLPYPPEPELSFVPENSPSASGTLDRPSDHPSAALHDVEPRSPSPRSPLPPPAFHDVIHTWATSLLSPGSPLPPASWADVIRTWAPVPNASHAPSEPATPLTNLFATFASPPPSPISRWSPPQCSSPSPTTSSVYNPYNCRSLACGVSHPHNTGSYFHPPPYPHQHEFTPWGFSNPPPAVWVAYGRTARIRGTWEDYAVARRPSEENAADRRDRDLVAGFMAHHGSLSSWLKGDEMRRFNDWAERHRMGLP